MSISPHEPVMRREWDMLPACPVPRSCDGTVGAGGHAEALLEAAPGSRLVGIDRDPEALAIAAARLQRFGDRLTLVHGSFTEVGEILGRLGLHVVDGLLLDLGVSSMQLDRPECGFSFSAAGPLDMRMDPTAGETCAGFIRRVGPDQLADILRRWGEERYAGRIARAIKEAARAGRLQTTTELAAVVARAVPSRERRLDPATRTFQALRIAVNRELEHLERFLARFPACLAPGGRLVAIAFHSIADRLVKWRLRELAAGWDFHPLARKPLRPNPRGIARPPVREKTIATYWAPLSDKHTTCSARRLVSRRGRRGHGRPVVELQFAAA